MRDLLTFTWGFGMQGAMFAAPEPWPILTATLERPLATFGPPQPAVTPDPDVWLACLGELPLLAQPGERWLYNTGSQVLGILAARAVGESFDKVLRERVLDPLGMHDTGFHAIDPSRLAAAYENRDGTLAMTDPPRRSVVSHSRLSTAAGVWCPPSTTLSPSAECCCVEEIRS